MPLQTHRRPARHGNYPAIAILVKHGKALAAAVAVLPVLAALCVVGVFGMHWSIVVAGVIVGVLAGFLFKVMVEDITVIITDMLLPRGGGGAVHSTWFVSILLVNFFLLSFRTSRDCRISPPRLATLAAAHLNGGEMQGCCRALSIRGVSPPPSFLVFSPPNARGCPNNGLVERDFDIR